VPESSSWMPCAPQGVKRFDDDDKHMLEYAKQMGFALMLPIRLSALSIKNVLFQ